MTIKPIRDLILVRRLESQSASIIENPNPKPEPYGIVLRVGPAVRHIATGEKVYFNRYSGIELESNGETLLLLSEPEILGYYTP
ncbi:hypothetical protein HMF8227_02321 [Saliniradius amylolyticus]|uniref:10 kDa chaperonin n=1 Tax=Saliniradius amylolyticus TaxID=2183582 RepID=A0A2S2E563_9ALTE|nr:hypothetical protein [Saliniradius amylolyticus]AWL12773.1 hypothetical protein HMF8227_02321 [Saliniradius amylolyticus]